MAGYILGLYPEFSCIADQCPSTCCSGWRIVVDREAYKRFCQIEDTMLRQDILGNLINKDGELRFRNRTNGDCAMLDADGLCRIQRQAQEQTLCNTCRKFPRLTANLSQGEQEDGVNIWLSLAASCPVVAEYILDGQVIWLRLESKGQIHSASVQEIEELAELVGMPNIISKSVQQLDLTEQFDSFVDIVMDVLDLMLHSPGIPYLEDSFDLYDAEEVDLEQFRAFFETTQEVWQQFIEQYTYYRYPSRYLEFPQETLEERNQQVQGELLLIRIMLCSRYCVKGILVKKDWLDILLWVYRFCVHGKTMEEKVHALFVSLGSELVLLL